MNLQDLINALEEFKKEYLTYSEKYKDIEILRFERDEFGSNIKISLELQDSYAEEVGYISLIGHILLDKENKKFEIVTE